MKAEGARGNGPSLPVPHPKPPCARLLSARASPPAFDPATRGLPERRQAKRFDQVGWTRAPGSSCSTSCSLSGALRSQTYPSAPDLSSPPRHGRPLLAQIPKEKLEIRVLAKTPLTNRGPVPPPPGLTESAFYQTTLLNRGSSILTLRPVSLRAGEAIPVCRGSPPPRDGLTRV